MTLARKGPEPGPPKICEARIVNQDGPGSNPCSGSYFGKLVTNLQELLVQAGLKALYHLIQAHPRFKQDPILDSG